MRRFLITLLLSIFLSSCGPTYNTQVLHTPENQHLKGHQKPYVVNGKVYRPLVSCSGFVEEGMASWYGKDFHGRKTSNGEIYDMYAMTAAHKTLPLGVSVKVRNLSNGREAEVRVNDRGPFVKERVIDLSYAAAKKLDIVGPGTAPVRIEVVGQGIEGGTGVLTPFEGSFSIQVGAFSVEQNARRLQEELKATSGTVNVHVERIDGKRFYRVRVGDYMSIEEALGALVEFESSGYVNCLIVANE